jgi:hypothetical protein
MVSMARKSFARNGPLVTVPTINPCRAWILSLIVVAAVAASDPGGTGEIQKRPSGPLQEAIYGFAVAEYCGLLNEPVVEGFYLLRAWIIARDQITPEQEHADHVAANIAADYQYGDHGLGGYRGWCRSDGLPAAYRFLIFRDAVLGK